MFGRSEQFVKELSGFISQNEPGLLVGMIIPVVMCFSLILKVTAILMWFLFFSFERLLTFLAVYNIIYRLLHNVC